MVSARTERISFADMRDHGVRHLLIYCADRHCSHSMDPWPDEVRLSDIAPRLICSACGKRGART